MEAYDECIHRSAVHHRLAAVKPCKSGRYANGQVPVFRCGHFGGECTLSAHLIQAPDGKRLPVCTGCEAATMVDPALIVSDANETEPPAVPPPRKHARPIVVDSAGRPATCLEGRLAGSTAFLLCGGPSIADMDLTELDNRGIFTIAVNQCAATAFRPNVFCCVDPPERFHEAIWRDPAVMKFTRRIHSHSRIRRIEPVTKILTTLDLSPHQCPNTWFFHDAFGFDAATFLDATAFVWGGTTTLNNGKAREIKNVMLCAVRLAYWLGVRRLIIVGADFWMQPGRPYGFDQAKESNACGSNNTTYGLLNRWFAELRPHAERLGFQIFNATVGGNLDAFPRIGFDAAVDMALEEIPKRIETAGLYG